VSLFLLVALAAAPQLDLAAAAIDADATAAGLRARSGPSLVGWTITVRDTDDPNVVEAVLRTPDGRHQRRRLTLGGASLDDRSRELAASLALLIEEDPASTASTPTTPDDSRGSKPAREIRGWLGLGPRLEVGSPPAGGLDLVGGAWLVRDHLQPLANLAWSSTASLGLRMHSVRFGGGLAAGAPLVVGRLWLGGHALLHAQWVQAREIRVLSSWTAATELGALFQARWTRLVVGVRTGIDLSLPALSLQGNATRLSRGPAAWVLAVNVGFVFG
jgi:hypothetical protein